MAKRTGSAELDMGCDPYAPMQMCWIDRSVPTVSQGQDLISRKRKWTEVNFGESPSCLCKSRRRKPQKLNKATPPFACPFARYDPAHHMDCITFDLKRIQDVKQHLRRKHYQHSQHCQRCQPSLGLIAPSKQNRLRVRLAGSDEEIWYEIWTILFDGAPRPASPYRMTLAEATTDALYGSWKQHRPTIVSSVLQALSCHPGLDEIRQQLPRLLPIILRAFVSGLAETILQGDAEPFSFSQPTSPTCDHHPAPDSSFSAAAETNDGGPDVSGLSAASTEGSLQDFTSTQPLQFWLPEPYSEPFIEYSSVPELASDSIYSSSNFFGATNVNSPEVMLGTPFGTPPLETRTPSSTQSEPWFDLQKLECSAFSSDLAVMVYPTRTWGENGSTLLNNSFQHTQRCRQ